MGARRSKEPDVFPVVFERQFDMPPEAPAWIAHLARWRVHHRTKARLLDLLPVRFEAASRAEVEKKAMDFWEMETKRVRTLEARAKKAAAARYGRVA